MKLLGIFYLSALYLLNPFTSRPNGISTYKLLLWSVIILILKMMQCSLK